MTFALFLQRGVLSAQTAGFTPLSTDYNAPPEILDLLNPMSAYTLKVDSGVHQYTPGIAGIKNNAPIIESSISSGRQYQATPYDAVTDTIVLVPNAGASEAGRAAFLSQIAQFAFYANEFQSSQAQVQPVFLGRQLTGDAGMCYSLIYDVQFATSGDWLEAAGSGDPDEEITLSVIRYFSWTPIPMGSNPKFYTFEQRGLIPGTDYDSGDLVLNDWQNATANHRNWLEQEVYNIYTTEPTPDLVNFIDIPKEDIPGDLPCLACFVVDRNDSASSAGLTIARSTGVLNSALSTNLYAETATLASPAGITSTFQVDATRGISSSPGANPTNDYVTQHVLAAGAISENTFVSWPIGQLNRASRFDIWVRCQLTAGTPADFPFYGRITSSSSGVTNAIVLRADGTVIPSASASTDTAIVYLGSIDFTQLSRFPLAFDTGESGFTDETYTFALRFGGRSAGAAATLRITDVLFIQYDECATYLPGAITLNSGGQIAIISDNTGYFSRNKADGAAINYDDTATPDAYIPLEMRGQWISLLPGRDNRLYFYQFFPGANATSLVNNSGNRVIMRVRMNILPQWRHNRAVL